MKKAITLALVAAMLTATGITAFAADTEVNQDTTPPTGATTVNYQVDPAYTVVIPESVTLTDADVTAIIKIYGADENSNVVIGKGQKVNVALTASANNFNVANTDGDTIAYTVNDKNAVADLTTVAECTAADGKKDTNITFTKTGTASYAGTYTDTLTFTVSLTAVKKDVTSVTIADKSVTSLAKGTTLNLTANVDDAATDKTVVWSSSDDSIASVENGVVTAKESGSATITVTATNGTEDTADDKTDTIMITVTNPATGISLNKSALTLAKGNTDNTLYATVTPNDADDKTVTWSSGDESIVTVDADGKVTAVKEGTARITAKTASNKTAVCTVTVVSYTSLKVGDVLEAGQSVYLTEPFYFIYNSNGSTKTMESGKSYTVRYISDYHWYDFYCQANRNSYTLFKTYQQGQGLRVKSGSGTESDPFQLELIS